MNPTDTVTAVLKDERTLALDEPLPIMPDRVKVTIEALPPVETSSYVEVMTEIRRRQIARGHVPPTLEVVDAEIETQRGSWDE